MCAGQLLCGKMVVMEMCDETSYPRAFSAFRKKKKKKKKHKDAHRLLKYMPRNISGNKAGSLPPSFDLEHRSKSGLQVIYPGTHEIKH